MEKIENNNEDTRIFDENIKIIKSEIEKIGFYIHEVPDDRRKKYYYDFLKNNNNIFGFTIIWILVFLIIGIFVNFSEIISGNFSSILAEEFWLFVFYFGIPIIIIDIILFFSRYFGEDDTNFLDLDRIRNNYIIFTDKYITFNSRFYSYKNLEKYKYLQKIFKKSDFDVNLISETKIDFIKFLNNIFNSRNLYFDDLEYYFLELYYNSHILQEEQENFQKFFLEKSKENILDEEIFLKLNNLNELISTLFVYREKILYISEGLGKKDFINFEKYDLWLKNNLLLPVKNMKNILENHKNFTEKLLGENKNNNSEQIIILNKRLELQRETLANNILILDEKISKLEK